MRRRLTAAVAAVVLLTGGAAAASSTSAPERLTEHGEPVMLTGVIEEPPAERTGVAELRLTGPGVQGVAVARSAQRSAQDPDRDPAQVSFPLKTAPCNLPGDVCSGGAVLPNGTWTLRLFEVDRPADQPEVERGEPTTFVVDVPALPPQDVTASLEGRTVTVAWARRVGPEKGFVEPDVRWTVGDGTGRAVTVGPEACTDGRCSTTFVYADDASGARTFTVAAGRPGDSPPTATRAEGSVVVPVVPGARPSPTADGGSGQATARSLGQGLGSFAPGAPAVPALPQAPPSVTPPQVADTFDPTLTYDDQLQPESGVPEPQAAPPSDGRGGVLTSNDALLDDGVARSLAGALLLLLVAAHLRAWLARSRPGELG